MMQGQLQLRIRRNLTVLYIKSACKFSRDLKAQEEAHTNDEFGEFWEDMFANASACVELVVAALESFANELLVDRASHFPAADKDGLDKLWTIYEKQSLFDKADLICFLRNTKPLDRGARPVQDIGDLIALRNALTHFKPEWFDQQITYANLSKRLASHFAGSRFFLNETLFPVAWATHDCTSWAIKSSIDYLQALEARAGIASGHDKHWTRLSY